MSNDLSFIQNINGRFHVGMTLMEARAKGVDKCTFRRDFYNLDKNGDGILSINEVMKERKRDERIEGFCAAAFGFCAVSDIIKYRTAGNFIWTALDCLIAGSSLRNYIKMKKQDKQYEEFFQKHRGVNINA